MNISLPSSLVDIVKEEVETKGYASVSEFIRELIRDWSRDRAVQAVLDAEEEIKKGKGIKLHSLADLR